MTKQKQNKLNIYHQKQLRRVIRKHYADKISNKKIYQKYNFKLTAIEIAKRRWQKFGHIVRLDKHYPANEIMKYDLTHNTQKSFRGKHRTTIVTQLNNYNIS